MLPNPPEPPALGRPDALAEKLIRNALQGPTGPPTVQHAPTMAPTNHIDMSAPKGSLFCVYLQPPEGADDEVSRMWIHRTLTIHACGHLVFPVHPVVQNLSSIEGFPVPIPWAGKLLIVEIAATEHTHIELVEGEPWMFIGAERLEACCEFLRARLPEAPEEDSEEAWKAFVRASQEAFLLSGGESSSDTSKEASTAPAGGEGAPEEERSTSA